MYDRHLAKDVFSLNLYTCTLKIEAAELLEKQSTKTEQSCSSVIDD